MMVWRIDHGRNASFDDSVFTFPRAWMRNPWSNSQVIDSDVEAQESHGWRASFERK
jgi:hypothetical protein